MRGCDITFSRWLCCRFLKCHGTPPRIHAGTPHWHSFGKCSALMGRKKCSEHNTPEAADGTIPHACFYRFLIHVRRAAAAAHMPDFILQARMIREKKKMSSKMASEIMASEAIASKFHGEKDGLRKSRPAPAPQPAKYPWKMRFVFFHSAPLNRCLVRSTSRLL